MGVIEEIVKKHQDGAIFNIFVTPESQNIIFPAGINEWRKCLEIKLHSPAKDNKANKEVINTVADFFDKPVSDVFVVSGGKKREKSVFIKGVTVNFVEGKLRDSLDGN